MDTEEGGRRGRGGKEEGRGGGKEEGRGGGKEGGNVCCKWSCKLSKSTYLAETNHDYTHSVRRPYPCNHFVFTSFISGWQKHTNVISCCVYGCMQGRVNGSSIRFSGAPKKLSNNRNGKRNLIV